MGAVLAQTIRVKYSKLESLQTYQEMFDPFKNSLIVLFVYIIEGPIHEHCEVAIEDSRALGGIIFFN